MGNAIGSSSSARDHGSRVYDIRDFGAISRGSYDAPTAMLNTAAFQLAYDTAYAGLSGNSYATVYVPAGDWYLSGPIFIDQNKVGFRGEGSSVSNIFNCVYQDIFVIGLFRKPTGISPSSDHFPDAWTGGPGGTKIYDNTAVTAAGQKWGLRTKADSHIAQQGGPLDRGPGDGYRTTRLLTIATYIDFTLAGTTIPPGRGSPLFPAAGSIMGMVVSNNGVPWALRIGAGIIFVLFRTVDVNGLNPVDRIASVYTLPATPGLIKLDLQFDLVNVQISAYVNGVQVSVSTGGLAAGFTAGAGLYFAVNENNPFGIGSTSEGILGTGSTIGGAIDCTFWGLKITSALVYTNRNTVGTNDNAGAGTPQTRLDAATITDFNRYFSYDNANTIAHPLTDSPTTVATNRLISVVTRNDNQPTTAFFCDNSLTGSPGWSPSPGPIEGLGLNCAGGNYGRCISVCVPNDVRVSDCRLYGGHQAIGAINSNTNYPYTIERCFLTAKDACIYLYSAGFVRISDCTFAGGLSALRFYGCSAEVKHCFVLGGGTPDYTIWSKGGSSLKVSGLYQDSEDADGGPTKAMIYASGNSGGSAGGLGHCVDLELFGGGRQAPGSALVILEDGGIEDGAILRPCRFSMRECAAEDNFATTIVRNNGKRWRGTIVADIVPQRPTWVQNLDPSGQGNVISQHDYFTGPPRDGTWGVNAHVLKVSSPAASQYTEWRCTATGSYGTGSPPTWYGLLPIDDGLSLAAYLQDNTYWAAPSMPVGGQGFWANGPMCLFLNALFGGSMPATPPGLYVGAASRQAFRIPLAVEMTGGNGYTRVATGAWTLTGAGATNATAITFPTATADWVRQGYYTVLNSLIFYDAAVGGNYFAAVDIPPTTVLNGQTLSYPAGSITVARAPSSLGLFADSVHAKMNGLWLNQTPFTVPAIYLALSTTPASLSAPTEPTGGGYARVATSAASWGRNPAATYSMYGAISTTGIVTNVSVLTFPAPTGGWGTAQSVYLMDAPSGGNVLGSANLAIPRTILSGSPARSFAVGALWLGRS